MKIRLFIRFFESAKKEPKSIGWKMRSKIGDRVPWYDESEKVEKLSAGS